MTLSPLRRMSPAAVAKELADLEIATVQSTDVDRIVKITQAAYDALPQKDARTMYAIVG